MAVLNPQEVAPEEKEAQREVTIGESLLGNTPDIPGGIKCVREFTPLVMTALQRTNNPYVTGKAGFEAAGISFSEDGNVKDPSQFAIRMMPYTAEVLICFTCPREDIKRYAVDAPALQSAALEYMENSTIEALAEATVFVSERLGVITKTRAVSAPDAKPKAAALEGDGNGAPKRRVRTGLHKS